MRHFIVSDLHGCGYTYDSIINFLSNELKYGNDDIVLHINGDLIDRGPDSGSMLVDVYDRIINNRDFKIDYLGGNHELMMYQTYLQTKKLGENKLLSCNFSPASFNWNCSNGGFITSSYLKKHYSTEDIINISNFIGNLNIYHKFSEKIDDKPVVLMHACFIQSIDKDKILKIKDNNASVEIALWTRKDDFLIGSHLGSSNYFNIIGHTPNKNMLGYSYDEKDNVLNIDGGCAIVGNTLINYYDSARNQFTRLEDVNMSFNDLDISVKEKLNIISHTPLVEIDSLNNRLKIFTFNSNNEIICANYFIEGNSYSMDSNELEKYRSNLKENQKVKRIRRV